MHKIARELPNRDEARVDERLMSFYSSSTHHTLVLDEADRKEKCSESHLRVPSWVVVRASCVQSASPLDLFLAERVVSRQFDLGARIWGDKRKMNLGGEAVADHCISIRGARQQGEVVAGGGAAAKDDQHLADCVLVKVGVRGDIGGRMRRRRGGCGGGRRGYWGHGRCRRRTCGGRRRRRCGRG